MEQSDSIIKKHSNPVKPLILHKKTISIVVALGVTLLIAAVLLWIQGEVDQWLLFSHDILRSIEPIAMAGKLASKYGMAIIVLTYLIYLLVAFKKENLGDSPQVILLVFLMFGIVGLGGDLLKEIINRPRPFVQFAGEYIAFSNAGTPAFPSGHATKSMALALPFLVLIPARDKWHLGVKILLTALAVGVSYSRVLLGAHYVSDVLAGIGLSMVCIPFVILLGNKILGNMNREKLNKAVRIWAFILLGLIIFLVAL